MPQAIQHKWRLSRKSCVPALYGRSAIRHFHCCSRSHQSRLESVKRALNGEFDAEGPSATTTTTPPAAAAAAATDAALVSELQSLRAQLAHREELLRQQEEARKVDLQERDAATAAMKRMEEVLTRFLSLAIPFISVRRWCSRLNKP